MLEEYNQIHKLDLNIMRSVCKDLREQMDAGRPPLPVSINFSRLDFENADVFEALEQAVSDYNIPKECLHVEITESALTENDSLLKTVVEKLQAAGYQIWLDDFGSGYSSLNVLKDYFFNVMKIDMVFLRNFDGNERAKELIRSIVNLANVMKMSALTEGVETKEQAEFLKQIGCVRLQGFYFGKPMPVEDLLSAIDEGKYRLAA